MMPNWQLRVSMATRERRKAGPWSSRYATKPRDPRVEVRNDSIRDPVR